MPIRAVVALLVAELAVVAVLMYALRRRFTRRSGNTATQRYSEERFRTLVSSMSDMVYSIDVAGRYDGLYGEWVEREKIDAAQFIGRTAIDIFGEEHGAAHRVAHERALEGHHVVYDWSTRAGPQQRFFTIALSPLRDAQGRILGAVGIGHEVTERHRKDAELANAQERLRHAQKLEAVGQLAGGVAHDFNNVLTVISAYSDMLASEVPEASPMHEPLAEIRQAANRAATLTRQLLAFSRRQTLHPHQVDLNEVVQGVVNLMARLLGPEHQLITQLAPDLDAVFADRGQLEQVLMNLAANARDAMPHPGRFTIATSRVVLDEDAALASGLDAGTYILLAARDTGTGMSAETQARLFEPFFTTKDVGKGTGLGLATVYGIVEQSRGHIRVDSAPGRGATFTIYLPSTRAALATSAEPTTALSHSVLLVDDEPSVRSATAKMLRDNGYDVLEAGDGEEALRLLRGNADRVGVLLTDMVMPGLSGRDLAQRVRAEYPRVAVAIMSGFIRESMIQDPSFRAGFAFVEKPFTMFTLTAALREAARSGVRR